MIEIPPGTTAAPVTVRSPAASAMLLAAGPARTLAAAAAGTLLVTAVFSAVVTTVADSARSLHAGVAGETWALSGMSLGLATALLTAGALADALGRRRVLLCGAGLLAAASALGAVACRDTQRLPCSFVHRSGGKSDRRIRRASTAWQFARRRAPIVRFCPARLLAALTPAQANLVGDSTFFRLRMGLQGRWPNARGGRSWHGAWSFFPGPVVKPGCVFRCRSGSRSRW